MAVWNIGNTTVRNPNRIELGLQVVHGFNLSGKLHGKIQETAFAQKLIDEGVVESKGSYIDLLGRKWRSVMVQMGFLTDNKYSLKNKTIKADEVLSKIFSGESIGSYQLTPIGKRLASATSAAEKQDIYLRQLVRYQIPNSIEKKIKHKKPLKPFLLILNFLYEAHVKKLKGLSKNEIAIFFQAVPSDNFPKVGTLLAEVEEYRTFRDSIKGKRDKNGFDRKFLLESAGRNGVQWGTLVDYADTTIRYFLLSGVLTYNGRRLIIREERIEDIKLILDQHSGIIKNEIEYLRDYYSGMKLVIDDDAVAKKRIKSLLYQLKEKGQIIDEKTFLKGDDEIVRKKYELEEKVMYLNEIEYANDQQKPEAVVDIESYLDKFVTNHKSLKDLLDQAAYFEWIVWRMFLAIDHIVSDITTTHGFPLDQDLLPRHPAAGGRPDMQFEFANFHLVVEVTLTKSARQHMTESEPIKRHIAEVAMKTKKRVIGLFVAPELDNNLTLSIQSPYYFGDKEIPLDIVGLSTKQLFSLLLKYKRQQFLPEDVEKLLDAVLRQKNLTPPAWKKETERIVNSWVN